MRTRRISPGGVVQLPSLMALGLVAAGAGAE